ncbi:MAG TPA: HIT family protein [Xanthobacteraceae bacterium]|nr:HIT family protein [Xanthobacteraceae bacterium]
MTAEGSKEGCIFCRIAGGEIPSVRLFEDDRILAFLDIRPIREGHALILPKRHYDFFEAMPEDLAAHILAAGQKLARALKKIYGVARVGFMFSGTDVAHAHAHVVPMAEGTDLTSRQYIAEENLTFRPPKMASSADLQKVAKKLRPMLASG